MLLTLILPLLLVNLASATTLETSGRWIRDAGTKDRVKLRCATWAGHLGANIPEGLQHQPVASIAQWVKVNRFNCVWLTFSIDMALNPDQLVSDSFASWLTYPVPANEEPLSAVYDRALSHNPWLANSTTRGAFERVISELDALDVMVVLSNHVSRAGGCCSLEDGNGWWNTDVDVAHGNSNNRYFDTNDWIVGLNRTALWALDYPNIVGLALRHSLRYPPPSEQDSDKINAENIKTWYNYVTEGAKTVLNANERLLVVVGGTDYGRELGFLWGPDQQLDRGVFKDKLVYEFHWPGFVGAIHDCEAQKEEVGRKAGYLLVQGEAYTGPLFVTGFSWTQDDSDTQMEEYARCISEYLIDNDAEWAYGKLQGSYYFLDGPYYLATNVKDVWGLLNPDWSRWGGALFPDVLAKMMEMTQWR